MHTGNPPGHTAKPCLESKGEKAYRAIKQSRVKNSRPIIIIIN